MNGLKLVASAKKTLRMRVGLCLAITLMLPWVASASQPTEGPWALRIVEKEFSKESGELRVQVQNTSDRLTVTAFGVMAVVGSSEGSQATQIVGSDLIPGEGLLPGEIQEVNFTFGAEPNPDERGLTARTVMLHYEVLSDLTSHGNEVFVNEIFQSRAFHAAEYQRALSRLRRERSLSTPTEAAAKFSAKELERALPAQRALAVPLRNTPSEEKDRYAAIKSVADMVGQIDRAIDLTGSPEAALDEFQWVMELQRDRYVENVRSQDLDRIVAQKEATDE